MVTTSLVFGSLLSILFFVVGLLIGWTVREYMLNYQDKPKLHQEFFDRNGNVIPDEVLAISFNPDYFDDDLEDEDED